MNKLNKPESIYRQLQLNLSRRPTQLKLLIPILWCHQEVDSLHQSTADINSFQLKRQAMSIWHPMLGLNKLQEISWMRQTTWSNKITTFCRILLAVSLFFCSLKLNYSWRWGPRRDWIIGLENKRGRILNERKSIIYRCRLFSLENNDRNCFSVTSVGILTIRILTGQYNHFPEFHCVFLHLQADCRRIFAR